MFQMSSDSDSSDSVLAEVFGASDEADNDQSLDACDDSGYGDKNDISETADSEWADEGERHCGNDVRDKQSGDTGDEEDDSRYRQSLQVLQDEYSDVGNTSPTYDGFNKPEQKRRIAKDFGGHKTQFKCAIGVLNTGFHWVAFYIDKEKGVLHETIYNTMKISLTKITEGVLEMKGQLKYKELSRCTKREGSSCGVWWIAILEILLSDAMWDDYIYNLLPSLRM
ncbi:hypothetical protein PHMEG_00020633 [Phytophthora megakarya]|uniref:Ubiquitin-like protease family profile domain-containing protein n=1 Tax=Phytophthora megakarya TaxID=4795 RepID=A0A225VPS5_9STRA|nr:hypothetical protein PHMEG_00020633 [Phytophthora megakarya]